MLLDLVVCVFYVQSLVVTNDISEPAILVDGDWSLALLYKAILNAGVVIILTKAWSAMHNAGTGVACDEISTDNCEAPLLLHVLEVVEEGNVFLSDECLTWDLFKNFVLLDVSLLEDFLQARFSENIYLLLFLVNNLQIDEFRVDGEGQVAGQGPRGSGPSDDAGVRVLFQWEGDDNSGIIHILVVGASLKVREHSVAGSREGHDPGATVDQTLIEDLLEGPPDTLHEIAIHGLVVIIEVDPSAESPDDVPSLI